MDNVGVEKVRREALIYNYQAAATRSNKLNNSLLLSQFESIPNIP